MIYARTLITTLLILTLQTVGLSDIGRISDSSYYDTFQHNGSINIKSVNGKFYAYIVLLFNENPHFVNMIQKDSIPLKVIGNEGFHIKEYKLYQKTLKRTNLKRIAKKMLTVYLEPYKFDKNKLKKIEKQLEKWNIIIKFSRERNTSQSKITLDYSIFGKKSPIKISHPLLNPGELFYNIQPYIYYEEFSTSNSTFYFDMIYINPIEVNNDYIIAKNILTGKETGSMFFVGSVVTNDIKYCLEKAFNKSRYIKKEIWKMFVIHELTHKILNNRYNNFDQITGEELSLCSTIYSNPHLGLAVMYSYLNYNSINPHRIAAMNFVRFIAKKTKRQEILNNPGLIKKISGKQLKQYSKEHFNSKIKEDPEQEAE